jgi:hypothetical protein
MDIAKRGGDACSLHGCRGDDGCGDGDDAGADVMGGRDGGPEVGGSGEAWWLQSDPVLDSVAQRANLETEAYAGHTARFQPIEDPMPMLRQLSYPAGKAKLLAGFGDAAQFADPQQKAVYGATLFGWDTIPDCSYTRYGADSLTDPKTGNVFTVIVLAGD